MIITNILILMEENNSMNYPINWQPIIKMRNHPHGEYLCLVYDKDDKYDPFSIQQRYFTYTEDGTGFESEEDSKGVVAFMIPRLYPRWALGQEEQLTKGLS